MILSHCHLIHLREPQLIEEHPDDMQLHGAVCPLLADLMTFSKASGGYPTPVAAAGAALTLQGYIRFHEKLEAEDQLLKVEQVFKRIAKELPVEDQLHIMDSVGDALPSFCAKMYKKAAGKKFQQEEVVRRHRLRNTAFGHLAWLRGHKLGSNLMPTWQVQKLAVEERKKNFIDRGPPRVGGDVWYKCWVPNSQKEWCYKGSFVNEVRFLAESQKMDFFWVTMDGARKIFKQSPAFEEALMYHVVAVSTDDQRYLWSFSFVQFLTILMENTNYPYGQAHLSPDDFRAKYPKAKFPVPGHYPTKPKSQAMTIPVPVIVSRNLRPTPTLFRHATLAAGDRDPPAPPPLPDRLPCPIPYEITEPWMCIFASELQKRDLGTMLEVQRSELAASRAAVLKDEDAETDAEQPEEEELEQDEEVDPAEDQRRQRRARREEVQEDADANDDLEGDEEQEVDLDNEDGEKGRRSKVSSAMTAEIHQPARSAKGALHGLFPLEKILNRAGHHVANPKIEGSRFGWTVAALWRCAPCFTKRDIVCLRVRSLITDMVGHFFPSLHA
eukprot:s115_g32.t1